MKRPWEIVCIIVRFYFDPDHWKSSWPATALRALWVFGTIWLVIEFSFHIFGDASVFPQTSATFWWSLSISILVALLTTTPPFSSEYRIANKDITIRLVLGSIFNQNGDKVIATNTTFDTTQLDGFISPASVQGQLTKREYDDIKHLDSEIIDKLTGMAPVENLSRSNSKSDRYEVGTTIKLTHRSDFYSYWVALADVNEHGQPTGSFRNLQQSLECLWEFIKEKGHHNTIVMPIIGSGKTGINETKLRLLQEIIFSFVAHSRENKLTDELVICIRPQDVFKDKVNMQELSKFLEYQCAYNYISSDSSSTSSAIS